VFPQINHDDMDKIYYPRVIAQIAASISRYIYGCNSSAAAVNPSLTIAANAERINDTCGHIEGDQILAALRELIRSTTRVTETVVRLPTVHNSDQIEAQPAIPVTTRNRPQ
jgi:hypothetical protein